ncbi:glycosyltransferase family 4 protein [Leptolyngbya cf. ectocarpi LEGE 11479]|uniref:Glycosyltransferase family 4 protein n=1 Tax=Leptolyngbya cf. ectocarpi LEGE 11479 TaxID=1828722 RepID=A0A928X5K6_LEPEC|nr:glycosyltransferase family 4 protein [Leptolyngbya ectocarpi]MBE9067343.1 glycosyltransferase family 4 protein [Leptolyngbya cf. ectocarpi LEGE 11479]
MHVAYLVNQYPKVSHSFIRREISGLEECDVRVSRYSIRSVNNTLVDPADQSEALKTRTILDIGLFLLFSQLIIMAIKRPIAWLKCFKIMLRLWFAADKSLFHYFAYMAEACVLFNWLKQDGVTHVHAHFGTNPTSVALLCHMLGGPTYSFTVHGPEEFDKPLALSLPTKIERAKFVVAISNFGRSQLYRWCSHKHWNKIHVVHCGLDSSFLSYESSVSIPDEANFVCVARLSEQKGHLLLLEAVKQLADRGYRFKVVLVGDGELRCELENLIAKWKIEDFIEITGWASGAIVRDKILESRALVLPSFAEGLPVVIMEALALGRPVISTYIAGIPELLGHNICGWLIPSGNVDALVEAMSKVIHEPISVLEDMGHFGAKQVSQQHNASIEARKLLHLFQDPVNTEKETIISEVGRSLIAKASQNV